MLEIKDRPEGTFLVDHNDVDVMKVDRMDENLVMHFLRQYNARIKPAETRVNKEIIPICGETMKHVTWEYNNKKMFALKMLPISNEAMMEDALNEIESKGKIAKAIVTSRRNIQDIKNLFSDRVTTSPYGTFLKMASKDPIKIERDDRCKEQTYIMYKKPDPVIFKELGDELP
jgi:hypothetical protein